MVLFLAVIVTGQPAVYNLLSGPVKRDQVIHEMAESFFTLKEARD